MYCRARLPLALGNELTCFLDDGHELVHPKHYDKINGCTWEIAKDEPSPVPASPVKPPSSLKEKKTREITGPALIAQLTEV